MMEFLVTHREKILPGVIIIISLGASLVYYISGDFRRGTYWLAAAVLNVSVVF
jgi:hypothetical protein